MKYADYETKRKALEAAQTARYDAGEKERKELHALREAIERKWSLGPPRFLDSGARSEHGDLVVIYDGGQDLRITVHDRSLMHHYGMELSQQYMRVSAEQWHMFAEIVDALTRWRAGETTELPPSGAWLVRGKR